MNFLLRPHLPLLLGDGCVFSASVSCRRLCPVFKGRWTAWPMAVVDLIKPPKATQSLKGAVLKGRGVLPPLNQAEYDPSPSWGVPSPNRTYHSIKNGASLGGPSPGSVLPRLPWGQESRALLQSSLQAGGGRGAEEGSPTHHTALGIPSNDPLCTILDFQGPGEGPWPLPWLTAQLLKCRGLLIGSQNVLTKEPSILYDEDEFLHGDRRVDWIKFSISFDLKMPRLPCDCFSGGHWFLTAKSNLKR